jgi:polysaccharide pyruvyl transferase WcaK-like protein
MKTYLYGSYGHHNGGDDAFVEVALWGYEKFCRPSCIVAEASMPLCTSQGVVKSAVTKRYFKGQHFIQHYISTRNLDRILYVGGGIHTFSEELKKQRKILERNPDAICAAIGVSVGPFKDQAAIDECKRFLEKFSYVGVRGKASLERLQSMDVQVRYELTFDIAVLMRELLNVPAKNTVCGGKTVGVSLLTQARAYHPAMNKEDLLKADEQRLEMVASMLNNLIQKKSCESVHLIDFCSHSIYSDFEIHERLKAKLLPGVPVIHEPYNNDPIALFKKVAGMDCMIAMRLHAAVFAYASGVPCLILPYQDKNIEWADMIKLPKDDLLDISGGDSQAYTERLQLFLASGSDKTILPLSDALQAARKNWEALADLNF